MGLEHFAALVEAWTFKARRGRVVHGSGSSAPRSLSASRNRRHKGEVCLSEEMVALMTIGDGGRVETDLGKEK